MKVLITGANGFLGRRLAQALVASGSLVDSRGRRRAITELHLADRVATPCAARTDIPIKALTGDLADPDFVGALVARGFDSIFHLASLLTLQAEDDPVRAYAVNVEALRRLIEGAANRPKLVFTSSIAVFGGTLPEQVDEDVVPNPQTTYGSHKAINEILIADYSRQKKIDGRSLRLPIVLTRPGSPQPAVSDQVAAIVREPLNGADVAAPFRPDTMVSVVSAGAVVRALLRLHDLVDNELPARRTLNLPALAVRIDEVASAVRQHDGAGAITYAPDAIVQKIVDGWPKRFVSQKATQLGIMPDADLPALISDYLEHRDIRGD